MYPEQQQGGGRQPPGQSQSHPGWPLSEPMPAAHALPVVMPETWAGDTPLPGMPVLGIGSWGGSLSISPGYPASLAASLAQSADGGAYLGAFQPVVNYSPALPVAPHRIMPLAHAPAAAGVGTAVAQPSATTTYSVEDLLRFIRSVPLEDEVAAVVVPALNNLDSSALAAIMKELGRQVRRPSGRGAHCGGGHCGGDPLARNGTRKKRAAGGAPPPAACGVVRHGTLDPRPSRSSTAPYNV